MKSGSSKSSRVTTARASTLAPLPPSSGPTVCNHEDLQLKPGELSTIDRRGKGLPQDTFRCFGCSEPACQVLVLFVIPRSLSTPEHGSISCTGAHRLRLQPVEVPARRISESYSDCTCVRCGGKQHEEPCSPCHARCFTMSHDTQVESPLEEAKKLSEAVGSKVCAGDAVFSDFNL